MIGQGLNSVLPDESTSRLQGATFSKAGFPVHFGVKDDAKKDTQKLLDRCAKDAVIESVEAAGYRFIAAAMDCELAA